MANMESDLTMHPVQAIQQVEHETEQAYFKCGWGNGWEHETWFMTDHTENIFTPVSQRLYIIRFSDPPNQQGNVQVEAYDLIHDINMIKSFTSENLRCAGWTAYKIHLFHEVPKQGEGIIIGTDGPCVKDHCPDWAKSKWLGGKRPFKMEFTPNIENIRAQIDNWRAHKFGDMMSM